MPKENKALKIVRARAADAVKRRTNAELACRAIDAEIKMLIAMETELVLAYQSKPKRAVKVKPSVVETPKPV